MKANPRSPRPNWRAPRAKWKNEKLLAQVKCADAALEVARTFANAQRVGIPASDALGAEDRHGRCSMCALSLQSRRISLFSRDSVYTFFFTT
jgi:hypothetical protein